MAPSEIRWSLKGFGALGAEGLYEVLRLRQRVFVVEQACAYLDLDGKDQAALHLIGHDVVSRDLVGHDTVGAIAAYARLLSPGVSYDVHAIGRVVTAPEHRGRGLGRALMRQAIASIVERAGGPVPIALGAQAHLEAFYGSLGFVRFGEPYDEDGIPHVHMRREADAAR